jgi:hypothetical protein
MERAQPVEVLSTISARVPCGTSVLSFLSLLGFPHDDILHLGKQHDPLRAGRRRWTGNRDKSRVVRISAVIRPRDWPTARAGALPIHPKCINGSYSFTEAGCPGTTSPIQEVETGFDATNVITALLPIPEKRNSRSCHHAGRCRRNASRRAGDGCGISALTHTPG